MPVLSRSGLVERDSSFWAAIQDTAMHGYSHSASVRSRARLFLSLSHATGKLEILLRGHRVDHTRTC